MSLMHCRVSISLSTKLTLLVMTFPGRQRWVPVWRLSGMSRSWAAAHSGSYSEEVYGRMGSMEIMAPARPIFRRRSSSLTASETESTLTMAMPFRRLGWGLQKSAR